MPSRHSEMLCNTVQSPDNPSHPPTPTLPQCTDVFRFVIALLSNVKCHRLLPLQVIRKLESFVCDKYAVAFFLLPLPLGCFMFNTRCSCSAKAAYFFLFFFSLPFQGFYILIFIYFFIFFGRGEFTGRSSRQHIRYTTMAAV